MANKDVISSNSVTRWGEQPPPEELKAEALLDDTAATPYPINEELNFKVALWQGDITKLEVDALINCNNADLNERAGISGQIFVGAGPQMEEACAKLGGCPPGDAKATRGFRLPAKHVIHAVPPAWIDGGEGDAALEALYIKSLDVARRLTCATVGCVPLKTKDVPREQAAHLAICAMRKHLESPEGKGIQLLVITMRPEDVYDNMIYDNLLPLYFPRSAAEEHDASKLLPLAQRTSAIDFSSPSPVRESVCKCSNNDFEVHKGNASTRWGSISFEPNPALSIITQQPKALLQSPEGCAGGFPSKEATHNGSAYSSFLHRALCVDIDRPPYLKVLRVRDDRVPYRAGAGLADLSDIESMQLFYRSHMPCSKRQAFFETHRMRHARFPCRP